jgi:Cyclin D1 binding domain
MISPDKLAQFWVGFGHISFYERVRIDDFISPFTNRTLVSLASSQIASMAGGGGGSIGGV